MSRNRCVSVVPFRVAIAVKWVPRSLVSLRTWIVVVIGVHMSLRSVARVVESDEKVRDLLCDILAPRSEKKIGFVEILR